MPKHCAHSFCNSFLLIQFTANLRYWNNTKFSALCFPRLEACEDPAEVKSQSQESLASSLGCRGIHFFVPSVFWGIPNLLVHIFPFLAPPSVSFFFCLFFHNQVFPEQSPERQSTFAGSCDETGNQADSSGSPNQKAPNHMYKVPLCSVRWHVHRFQGLGCRHLCETLL